MRVVPINEDIPEFIEAANWLHDNVAGSQLAWLSPARHASILEQRNPSSRLAASHCEPTGSHVPMTRSISNKCFALSVCRP
jgi:hypothetical protein